MSLFHDETDENRGMKGIAYIHNLPDTVHPVNAPATTKQKNSTKRKDVQMKRAAFALLREQGVGPTQAARALGYTPQTGSRMERQMNAYEIRRDKLLSKSVQTIEKFIQGKPVGQVVDPETGEAKGGVQPKGSDVMRAVELVMDREQPKVTLSASVTAEFMPIDLGAYE